MKLYLPENLFEFIKKRLEDETDPRLTYHNWEHTEKVMEQSEYFAGLCGKNLTEIKLLQTAALFHDIGYLMRYDDNEGISADYAGEILPEYGYTEDEIEEIKRMIRSTVLGTFPEHELDQILCDADISHAGSPKFYAAGEKFRKELELVKGLVYTELDWIELELQFLLNHEFKHYKIKKILQSQKDKNIQKMRDFISAHQQKTEADV